MDFLVRKQGVSRKPLDPEAPARFLTNAGTARESNVNWRKPYSVIRFGRVNRSLDAADSGPP